MTFGKRGLIAPEYSSTTEQVGEHLSQRESRVHRLMKVTIFHERFGSAEGVLRDISSGGLGGRCNAMLSPGDVIEIERPGLGRFEAEVRWVRNSHFGAQLTSDMRIDTKAVENLSFNSSGWQSGGEKQPAHHVFTRFRPVTTAYRPGIAVLRRDI